MRKHHPNEFMRTNLNSGRIAGTGIPEGDYSEDKEKENEENNV